MFTLMAAKGNRFHYWMYVPNFSRRLVKANGGWVLSFRTSSQLACAIGNDQDPVLEMNRKGIPFKVSIWDGL